ncbi:hypothetical protein [Streptomyces sp. NPDC091371]|uniref:hypothetical protein n=1 Tax=Streptomyces sp. NPDC091371 TaxID=3155303 RepID=UPI00341EC1BF
MVAGRRIRFAAVLVGVVLALTGFSSHGGSSGSGGSGKSNSSGSGGGCSSSKSGSGKTHVGGGSAATATATATASGSVAPATVEVITCAGSTPPATTLRFTSTLNIKATFSVNLYRESGTGAVIEQSVVKVTLEAREARTVDVVLKDASRAAQVMKCRVDAPVRGTETGSGTGGVTGGGTGATPKATPKATAPAKATPKATRSH